ncbi:hypothetical protein Tco_0413247 [Tanacetum coccineum]
MDEGVKLFPDEDGGGMRMEITENFSCPFCLVKCASYKGLRFHLTASHDIFHYEFWATEDYQVVIVSMRTDISSSEMIPETVDPKQQTKPKSLTQNANNVHPLVLDSAMSASLRVPKSMEHDSPDASATGHPIAEPKSVQLVPEENHAPSAMLQFAKTRKLSAEGSDLN